MDHEFDGVSFYPRIFDLMTGALRVNASIPPLDYILVGQPSWAHQDILRYATSASRQRTNPLPREGLAARSGDYVCRSNSLNERR